MSCPSLLQHSSRLQCRSGGLSRVVLFTSSLGSSASAAPAYGHVCSMARMTVSGSSPATCATSAVGPRHSRTVWKLCRRSLVNVGGWTPAFENFVQVVVVFLGLRVFASEACFMLGRNSSMVKLLVPLRVWGGCRHLHALRRRFCGAGCFAGMGFSRVPGRRHLLARQCPWSLGGRGGNGNSAVRPLLSSRRTPAAVSFVVLARLYSYGHRSCRPQPLGSRREGAP